MHALQGGRRPCFGWIILGQGQGWLEKKMIKVGDREVEEQRLYVGVPWQLYLRDINYIDHKCFCCPSTDKPGNIEVKQKVKRSYFKESKWTEFGEEWKEETYKVLRKEEQELDRHKAKLHGPFRITLDKKLPHGTFFHAKAKSAGIWQPNKIIWRDLVRLDVWEKKRTKVYDPISWCDWPSFEFPNYDFNRIAQMRAQPWSKALGTKWWYDLEIWRDCPDDHDDMKIDHTQFIFQLRLRINPLRKPFGLEAELKGTAPKWIK